MRKQLGIAAVVVVAVVGYLALRSWQSKRLEEAQGRNEAISEATVAMKALNEADATFPGAVRAELSSVALDAMVAPARAGQTLEAKLVPMFDRYLATFARAIAGAERVLALEPDPDVAANVERIRARAATVRTMRDGLTALRARIAAGATGDEISRELQAIAVQALMTSSGAPPPAGR